MKQRSITAVAWQGGKLEWTVLAEQAGGWKTAAHDAKTVANPPTVEELQPCAKSWAGSLWLTLPAAQTLLRVVSLPTTDDAELRGMAELQIDKFSPFPADSMVMALEVIERQEKATRVLIAAAQRDAIAAQAAPLLAAGLLPAGVGVDVLGWWENIKAAGKLAERGGEVVILLTPTGAELMALHNGHPLLFRTLCQNPVGGTELIEELDLALLALEAEWGEAALRLSIWRAPEVPAALAESIQGHTGLHTTVQELGTLSTLSAGIALRVCETKETAVNLVLPDWLVLARLRRRRRGLIITALVAGLIWLLGLAVAVSGSQWQQHVATQLQHEQALLEGPAAEVRQQQAQLRLLQQYADPVGSALECLRDISAALPDGVKLTSLTFVKGQQITLRGEADDAKSIYTFQQGLKSSTRFKQVQLHGITPAAGKQTHTGFNVTLTLGEEATP